MRIIEGAGQEPFTTIAAYKLKPSRTVFFGGKALLRSLKKLPGLASAALFRSYGLGSAVVYLQWEDRSSAETGIASTQYQKCLANLGENTFPATLCEVVFVDDARPVQDHLKAASFDSSKEKHTTLVGTFDVEPSRREELLSLLRRDHTFLREFDGFVSVSFHKAIQRDNVLVEILQFQSPLQLRAVSKTPKGAAHLAAVDSVGKVTANIYHQSFSS